ncbi:type II secretion system protein [Fructobacillus durionis]|nr:type II secretion system protein [Fructobacillus durionis]
MLKIRGQPAFTLLESLVALAVMGMVFTGLSYLIRGRTINQPPISEERLAAVCQQLQKQGYVLEKSTSHQLTLSKDDREGQKILSVVNGQLVLQGDKRGKMVLLNRVKQIDFQNFGSYQRVTVRDAKDKKAVAVLFLDRRKEAEHVEKP